MTAFNTDNILARLCVLEQQPKVRYYIGVDSQDEVKAYCLGYKTPSDFFQIVLIKKSTDEASFNEEVSNLAKYFNAEIITSKF